MKLAPVVDAKKMKLTCFLNAVMLGQCGLDLPSSSCFTFYRPRTSLADCNDLAARTSL